MPDICQATPAPRVIMTKCVVDTSILFFWFKTALRLGTYFAFAAFRSRLPPLNPTPRGKAESIVKIRCPAKAVTKHNRSGCGMRKPPWQQEGRQEAARESAVYNENARCGLRRLCFLPPNSCGSRLPSLLPPSDSTPRAGAQKCCSVRYYSHLSARQ